MRRILLLMAVLGATSLSYGQASLFSGIVFNRIGTPQSGASVALCDSQPSSTTPCGSSSLSITYTDIGLGTPCTIVSVATGPASGPSCTNPGLTDSLGNYTFFGLAGAGYWNQIFGYQVTTQSNPVILPGTATVANAIVNNPNATQTIKGSSAAIISLRVDCPNGAASNLACFDVRNLSGTSLWKFQQDGQLVSSVSTGISPFSITSTTMVSNLNVNFLQGASWSSPLSIGSVAPNAGAFTTLSASGASTLAAITGTTLGVTGQISSTLATGTAPLSVASVTPVANLVVSAHPQVYTCGTTVACSATAQTNPVIIHGSVPLTAGTATVTGLPTISTTLSHCVANDITDATKTTRCVVASTSSITLTGTGTDTLSYILTGK